MALSDEEKGRVYYHLGYLQVHPAASIQLGIPRPIQTVFLVESAVGNLIESACDRVRKILTIMDGIEDKLVEAQDHLAATALDTLKLRADEPDALEKEYVRWGNRLADILGCPIYPHSQRYKNGGGIRAGNLPVRS